MSTQIEINTDKALLATAPAIAREEQNIRPYLDAQKREAKHAQQALEKYMARSWWGKLFATHPLYGNGIYQLPPLPGQDFGPLERLCALRNALERHEGHTVLLGVDDMRLLFPKEAN